MAFDQACYYANVDLVIELYMLTGLTAFYFLHAAWLLRKYKGVLKKQNQYPLKIFAFLDTVQLLFLIASVVFDGYYTGDMQSK